MLATKRPAFFVKNPELIEGATEDGVELVLPYVGKRIAANSALLAILDYFSEPAQLTDSLNDVVSRQLIDELVLNSVIVDSLSCAACRGMLVSSSSATSQNRGWIELPASEKVPILVGAPFSNDLHAWLSQSRGTEEVVSYLRPSEEPLFAYLGDILRCADEGSGAFFDRLEQLSKLLFTRNRLPILVGGDHSISLAPVKAAKKCFDEVFFVSIDAHRDDAPIKSSDGHLAPVTNANVVSHISAELGEENVAVLGARSGQSTGLHSDYFGSLCRDTSEIKKKSINRAVYVSVDIDVVDPSFAPDVNYPRPGGVSPRELATVLSELLQTCHVIAFDFVETCASPARENKTAQCVASLISSLSAQIGEQFVE